MADASSNTGDGAAASDASSSSSKSSSSKEELSRGYLTTDGTEFYLGHTGQDCASVCFAADRSCSADLSTVTPQVFETLGITCDELPNTLVGATETRFVCFLFRCSVDIFP